MKRNFSQPLFLICAVLILATGGLAQSEAQRLNARLSELYQKGDLDGAVSVAEEIVAIERKNSPVSKRNLTSALENLSQIKLDRVKRSMGELRSAETKPEKVPTILKTLRQDAAETETILREALELSAGATDPSQGISLKTNLAWLLYNYVPTDPNSSIGFDKDSRDKLEMRDRSRYSDRFEAARTLYSDAVREARTGDASGSMAMAANFNLAEFEAAMGNFEAAIPIYVQVLADGERILGKSNPQLLAPYESFLKVLVAVGQQEQAFEVLSKIVKVSGKSAQYPKTLLNLTYRSEKPFAPSNSKRIEDDSRAMKETAELAGRGTVARTAAAGGDIVGTSLSISTHGRDFYETSDARGVKVKKVPVRIEVDESGKVIAAEGLSTDRSLKGSAESAVREWRFRPFALDGKPAKLKGYAEVTILSN
jgi:tetratricopeptide (TPR) repeat protein